MITKINTVKDIEQLCYDITETTNKLAHVEGQIHALHLQIERDYGVSTFEELSNLQTKLQKDKAVLSEQLIRICGELNGLLNQ